MKNKMMWLFGGLAVLIIGTGVVVYKAVSGPRPPQAFQEAPVAETLPTVDSTVNVAVTKAAKANTVVLTVAGLGGKYSTLSYEFSYESLGLIKGVNSGSKPIDVSGKDSFSREIYLGTCSKNDCKPDPGVTKVTVNLVFADSSGKQSQFSKDFGL